VWAVLSRHLLEANRAADAVVAAERALALDPRHAGGRAARKQAVAVLETTDQALAVKELQAALNPDDDAVQLEMGHTYAELDRFADAERHFKLALGLPDAQAALAALYLRVGIKDGAEYHARQALIADPGNAVASQTLASILQDRGENAAGQALLDEAYTRNSLFLEPAQNSRLTVLILATQTGGNIPYRHLMPSTLYSRLVWYMEHAKPDQALPAYDVVFNTVGDPDLAFAAQRPIHQFLPRCSRPLLNAPDQVAATFRHLIPSLLDGIEDIVVPATVRIAAKTIADLGLVEAAKNAGLAPPLLVRPTGSHGGRKLARADTLADLQALDGEFSGEDIYLTRYYDYRSADGFYRKGRMIFVDRQPYPYHWALAGDWLVHYESAGMAGQVARQAEEALYLNDPVGLIGEKAMAAIGRIGQRLDLDYGGLDFSILPDGRVLVFEANATMLVHPEDPAGEFAYKNGPVQRILDAFQQRLAQAAAV
jgi:tetratricopeptide (TPR) repeat protein